jgi:predicted metalloprotease
LSPLAALVVLLMCAPPLPAQSPGKPPDEIHRFIAVVLASTEVVWKDIFSRGRETYRPPILVLYRDATHGACGRAMSSMGPIYCSANQRIYFDPSFLDNLRARFPGCNGDACQFAGAYVIARPVGSHVQNLLGILARGQNAQQPDRIEMRVELQADCLTGVWAKHQNDLDRSQSRPPLLSKASLNRHWAPSRQWKTLYYRSKLRFPAHDLPPSSAAMDIDRFHAGNR